ncbi:MAG: GHKL domain-containing protein [Lachnospiraceae bacterium]|nr:GHKL domain-containing protein [Lachnospiraceae bacterium]
MLYLVDNLFNFIIYLFIVYYGFNLKPRKSKLLIVLSITTVFLGAIISSIFCINSPWIYLAWSMLSICLFFDSNILHLGLISVGLMIFTGIIDTFSVMFVQVIFIGRGVSDTSLNWWMESAYIISFLFYYVVYRFVLKRNSIYLCDVENKYLILLILQGGIFQTFYNLVFASFNTNSASYGLDAYLLFSISIVGTIYSLSMTLNLAVKNLLTKRQNEEMKRYVTIRAKQYSFQSKQEMTMRKFKHDYKNHLYAIKELISNNMYEEAKKYLSKIMKEQDDIDLRIKTGNDFLDILINYYAYQATEENVEFKVSGRIMNEIPLEMMDTTTLLGNVLQNALEAAVKSSAPSIEINLTDHKNEIFITVTNTIESIKGGISVFSKTTKNDPLNHGIGLRNINEVIRKAQGEIIMEEISDLDSSKVRVYISIPRYKENAV